MTRRSLEPREVASSAEFSTELVALSASERRRLDQVARDRIAVLGRTLSSGRDHEDLIQEAILRTLAGERTWRKGISLIFHLDQVMKSIVSSWAKHFSRARSGGLQETPATLEESSPVALELAEQEAENVESQRINQQDLEQVRARFQDDPVAAQVLDGWAMGMDRQEICEIGEIRPNDYHAAVKRIRRNAVR